MTDAEVRDFAKRTTGRQVLTLTRTGRNSYYHHGEASFEETRPIGVAPAHWFRSDEFVEPNAFPLPCFRLGWDAYSLPSGRDYFIHTSHWKPWTGVVKTTAAYDKVWKELQTLAPQAGHEVLTSANERPFRPRTRSELKLG